MVDGYSFQEAKHYKPDAEDVWATDIPVHSPDTLISKQQAAVIVENRVLANLIPIILHSSSVPGPEWPVYVVTSEENQRILLQSFPIKKGLSAGRF